MLNTEGNYKIEVMNNIFKVFHQDLLPPDHYKFLEFLSESLHFKPSVIYDIGSAVLHWERHAKRIWTDSNIICFDSCKGVYRLRDMP